ncbi:MAG: GNAT family N-acetyltransferase [Clostridia bacterium]|nr:GNAT family N-acetyltransferase [Clostridia bacterium]
MKERRIDEELTLVPYYPNEEETLAWYQDEGLCMQVDGVPGPYTPERLRAMYGFLSAHGECYYIQYRGRLVGDVTLRENGEVCIVVIPPYQNRHIGRRCVAEMLALAREKGFAQVNAQIYSFNEQSRRMFLAAGFQHTAGDWFARELP